MAPIRRRLTRAAGLVGTAVLLSGCAFVEGGSDHPLTTFDPKGIFSRQIDDLFWLVFAVAAVVFFLVMGGLIVILFLFRDRKKEGQKEPKQLHGSPKLEVVWTVIPALILAALAVPTVSSIFDLTDCSPDAMEIQVIGHQWWFEFYYPDADVHTANIMVMPAGREVCAQLTSADVIHSFWIPALNGKRDVIPGQTEILPLEANEPGEFWGHCAEFCGLSHSLMRIRGLAVTSGEFDDWIAAQQEPAHWPQEGEPGYEGAQVFLSKGCTQCHTVRSDDEGAPPPVPVDQFHAPDLTHFGSRYVFAGASLPEEGESKDEALKRWLANPPDVKPGSFMPNLALTEAEIDSLIVWLESNE